MIALYVFGMLKRAKANKSSITIRMVKTSIINKYKNYIGVNSVKFSPDGNCLLSGSKDGTINLFDLRTHKLIQHYIAGEAAVNSISFHPSGYFVASA
jgi:centriolar protein POC1